MNKRNAVTTVLAGLVLGASAYAGEAKTYTGTLDLWLLPYDERGACSVTVGLRNTSGVRQDEGWLTLRWLDAEGAEIAPPSRVRMDPLLPRRYNAKNAALEVRCSEIAGVQVESAEWRLWQPDRAAEPVVVAISGVAGTRWTPEWREAEAAFEGVVVPE